MRQLRITHLEDAEICKSEHRFGAAATAHKTNVPNRAHFVKETTNSSNFTKIHI